MIKNKKDYFLNECPISRNEGLVRRSILGKDLFKLYESYHGKKIDEKYFKIDEEQKIYELYSEESGLIWYSPLFLGDGSYYKHLEKTFPWYYNPASWDKSKCLEDAVMLNPDWVVEIGCGDGWLLSRIQSHGIDCMGIEVNENAVDQCSSQGLSVITPDTDLKPKKGNGILCLLQTIEHLNDPLNIVSNYLNKLNPKYLIISAPCFESILGHSEDPLSWPPHHATSWSEKSMKYLGEKLGITLHSIDYSRLTFDQFRGCVSQQHNGRLFGLPNIPNKPFDKFFYWAGKLYGSHWATRSHSIYACFKC